MDKILQILKSIGEYWKGLLVISSIVTTIVTVTLKINNRVETDNDKVLQAVHTMGDSLNKKIDAQARKNADEFGKIYLQVTGMSGQMKLLVHNDSSTHSLVVKHMRETLKELDFYRFMEQNDQKKNYSLNTTKLKRY